MLLDIPIKECNVDGHINIYRIKDQGCLPQSASFKVIELDFLTFKLMWIHGSSCKRWRCSMQLDVASCNPSWFTCNIFICQRYTACVFICRCSWGLCFVLQNSWFFMRWKEDLMELYNIQFSLMVLLWSWTKISSQQQYFGDDDDPIAQFSFWAYFITYGLDKEISKRH